MDRQVFRQAICIILCFSLFGCSSAYNLNLYSSPSGAIVQVGNNVRGRTPCNIEIPRNSKYIEDNHIDVTYTLEGGREIVKSYDLRNYEPPSDLALFGFGIFAVPGALLFGLSRSQETDQYTFSNKDDGTDWAGIGVGIGLMGLGALTYFVLGGDFGAKHDYDIYEVFDETNNTQIN